MSQDLEERIRKIELEATARSVTQANIEKRLESIEDSIKWLSKLVLGGIIMGLLAYILKGGLILA